MDTPFEHASKQLQVLLSLFEEHPPEQSLNEAQTRFAFIDSLLFDCLGWNRTDCVVEERCEGLIADYSLSAPRRILIVEAKRENIFFTLPAEITQSRIWQIKSFKRVCPNVYDAIQQALTYAAQRGAPFAAVCNGHQIVAFLGSRTDGVEPLNGRAIVFSSLREIESHFEEFWNLLSKPAISQRRLQVTLQSDGRPAPPLKLSTTITEYPGLKRRNKLQVQLSAVADHLLEDFLRGQGEVEFLRACYCRSGPLAEYAVISKNILRARYSSLFEKLTSGPQLEPVVDQSGPKTEEILQVLPGRPVLLLGDIGVGKSLFLQHFIKIDAAELKDSTLFIKIDFLRMPTLRVKELWAHVIREVRAQLAEEHGIEVDADEFVRKVYHRELTRFAATPHGRLKGVDDAEYERRRADFLCRYLDDDTHHLQSAVRAIQNGTRKQVILVLDNIDHHVPEFQEEVFRIAEHIADAWGIAVFLAMRPSTYYQSKKRGAIAAYQPRAFTVGPPRVSEVIDRRLSWLQTLLRDQADGTFETVRRTIPSLADYLAVVARSFCNNEELVECVENLCGGNVRRALDNIRDFMSSGHVDTDDILQHKATYVISRHQFMRAVLYRDGEHYDPAASEIVNLFDISEDDGREHFLTLLLLTELDQWARMRPGEGFVTAGEIFQSLESSGFRPEQIEFGLQRLLSGGLIEGAHKGSREPGLIEDSIRITTTGGYYCRTLVRMFTYVDAIIVDTPIVEERYGKAICLAEDIDARLERASVFREYLDNQWAKVSGSLVFDWPVISEAIGDEIKLIREHPRRERRHHY